MIKQNERKLTTSIVMVKARVLHPNKALIWTLK